MSLYYTLHDSFVLKSSVLSIQGVLVSRYLAIVRRKVFNYGTGDPF